MAFLPVVGHRLSRRSCPTPLRRVETSLTLLELLDSPWLGTLFPHRGRDGLERLCLRSLKPFKLDAHVFFFGFHRRGDGLSN